MRVVIAEDSVLLREGLERLLGENGLDVVGSCGNADELLQSVRSDDPDVAVVDIRLPPTHNDEGMRAALEIRAAHPETGVLVLSQYVEVGLAMQLLAESAEGAGYLLKDRISDVKEFVAAVRRVATGGSAIDPIIVSTLLSRRRSDDSLTALTPREREVLELMAEGQVESGDRGQARDQPAGGREVRLQHLRQARPAVERRRLAPRAGGAAVPQILSAAAAEPPETRPSKPPVTRLPSSAGACERGCP